MDSGKLNDWMQVVGIFALVASLIFVGLQMKQTKEIALNEAGFNSSGSTVEMYSLENEYADIWVKGNAGEILIGSEAAVYDNLIRNRENRAFWESNAFRRLGSTRDIPLASFVMFLHQNPGARKQWEQNYKVAIAYRKAQYPDFEPTNFGTKIQAQLKRLEDMSFE